MDIYSIIFIAGYYSAIFSMLKNVKYMIIPVIILKIVTLFFLSAFRSMNVGYDNVGHKRYFYDIALERVSIIEFTEPGYALLSHIISFFGDYNLFIIVYAAISLILLLISIKYFSINPYISLYIYYAAYFLGNNMAKLRQSMSVLILMIALISLHKNDIKYFVLLVVVASTFHLSALFFLIFLFLYKVDLPQKNMAVIIIISIVVGQSGLVEFLYYDLIGSSEFLRSIDFLGLERLPRYAHIHHTVRESGGYLGYAYVLVNAVLLTFFYDKLRIMFGSKGLIIAKAYYWGSILTILLFNLALIHSRIAMGFMLTQIFFIPYLFRCIENKYLRVLFASLLLLVVGLRGYLGFLDDYHLFVPFEFFWDK